MMIPQQTVGTGINEAESRLLERENRNRAALAVLRKEPFVGLTLDEFRSSIITVKGQEAWDRLVLRERERLLAVRWADQAKDWY